MELGTTNTDDQLLSQFSKILVYGDSGVGKTRLISTCTPDDPSKTLIISAENKLISLRGSGIPVHQVNSFRDFLDVVAELEKNEHGFEWVAIDSISELATMALDKAQSGNKHGMAAYGVMFEDVMGALRRCQRLDVNIYYICQQKVEKDNEGVSTTGLRLAGKALPEKLPYDFDEIFHYAATRKNGETVRMLQTFADGKVTAKDGSGNLDGFVEPNLADIHKKILEDEATREERRKQVEEERKAANMERARLEIVELEKVLSSFDETTRLRFFGSCEVFWNCELLSVSPSKLKAFCTSLKKKDKAGTLNEDIHAFIEKNPGEAVEECSEQEGCPASILEEFDNTVKALNESDYKSLGAEICTHNKIDELHEIDGETLKGYIETLSIGDDIEAAVASFVAGLSK